MMDYNNNIPEPLTTTAPLQHQSAAVAAGGRYLNGEPFSPTQWWVGQKEGMHG